LAFEIEWTLFNHFARGCSFEPRILAAGALVGLTSSYISTPFELVKCQMQLHRTLPASTSTVSPALNPYRSSVQAAIHIAKAHGLLTLWRGFMVNTVRESLFLAVYFFAYEHSKSAFSKLLVDRWHAVESQAAAIALAGGLSGACAWFISFPLDCIKSVVQGRPFNAAPTQSSFEIARQLFKARGVGGFYAGVLPSVARAFIVSGTRFSAYESALAHLKQFDLFGSHNS
jgi:solute carrier family 25 carnitine/acylcarnitine transporter 20/29